ncbi:LmeA family phospholipid-binding protein [Streptomyces sp. P1-3]|uniref:LmeA family phospholipid-binding protein n=1 Tax=Streptomyces sp. P1-3 TaxID=3421658 RepID=UPI003D366F5A
MTEPTHTTNAAYPADSPYPPAAADAHQQPAYQEPAYQEPADPEPARREPRRRRGRGLRITLVVLVVLGGLGVVADRVAVDFAETEAAEKIKSRQGLSITPEVSIKGFPFLTQALDKKLDEVEVGLDGLTATTDDGHNVTITELSATLHQVKISGDFSSATADRASGRAHISYADLSAAAGEGIRVSQAGKAGANANRVKITGSFMGLGLSADGTVSVVNGDTIRLRIDAVPEGIPARFEGQIREKTDKDWKISGMPNGLRLEKVETTQDGIDLSGAGTAVSLTS